MIIDIGKHDRISHLFILKVLLLIKSLNQDQRQKMSEIILGIIAVAVLAVGIYCMCKDNG